LTFVKQTALIIKPQQTLVKTVAKIS